MPAAPRTSRLRPNEQTARGAESWTGLRRKSTLQVVIAEIVDCAYSSGTPATWDQSPLTPSRATAAGRGPRRALGTAPRGNRRHSGDPSGGADALRVLAGLAQPFCGRDAKLHVRALGPPQQARRTTAMI